MSAEASVGEAEAGTVYVPNRTLYRKGLAPEMHRLAIGETRCVDGHGTHWYAVPRAWAEQYGLEHYADLEQGQVIHEQVAP